MRSVENTFHLGFGVVYNALVEVKSGVGQEVAVFRHVEFISASQVNPLLSLRDTCLVARVKRQFRILPQSLWLFAKLLQPRLAIRLPQEARGKWAAFTLAEVFSPCRKVKLNFGFTLAEVLITLGIIGIVAALVIPNIVTKYQKHVTVSHLKKAYSIVSQALVSSQAENGDMVEWGLDNAGDFMAGGIDNSAAAYAAITNTYVNKYFIPYLNVADNCGLKCNRQKNIKRYRLNGQQWLWYRHYVVYLKDGMIIAFSFDNVNGLMNTIHTYVDINGDQKPNISGRDIFTFNFNSSTNKVNFAGSEFNRSQLLADWRSCCNKNAGDYSGDYCGALIQLDGWKIAPDYPW